MFNPPGMQPFPSNPSIPRANIIYPSQMINPSIISAPPILTAPKVPPGMVPPPPYPMMMNPMNNPMNNMNTPPSLPPPNPPMMNLGPPPPFNMMGGPGFMGSTPIMPVLGKSDTIKKVFVKNIPNDVPDDFMESILKECGAIVNWKRMKNEKDIPMPFGHCEFETVEGVLRSIRLLNGLKLVDKELQIKPSEKTEMFIKEWKELRKREWEMNHREEGGAERKEFDIFLERDDGEAIEKINEYVGKLNIDKIREDKEREEEKKEHPRERERESRRRQLKRENERKFKEKLSDWIRREEDKEKDRKREREKEKEKEREKIKLLERELNCDSDEERKRKTLKYQKIYQERKKTRQRELEEDEIERKKELQLEEKPPEPEESEMMIKPPSPEKEIPEPEEYQEEERKNQKWNFISQNEITIVKNPNDPIKIENASISLDLKKKMENEKNALLTNSQTANAFTIEEEEDENSMNPTRKHKPLTKIPGDKSIAARNEEIEKQNKLNSQTILSNESIKRELENIISQIPKNKTDLFEFPINWTLFATTNLLDKKVKPWLIAKSIEYIGTEEQAFVSMIYKKVANKESPYEILKKVEKVLDEDGEDFVMKLWRMIIFELLKAKINL